MAAVATAALALALPAQAQDLPVLTVGTLAGGTVSWELETITEHGFDEANGFTLEKQDFAGNPATQVALQGGAVDAIVTDCVWAAQADAGGLELSFIPYSTAVGGLLVAGDSPAQTLADLKGQKIAVSGSPLDKTWVLLRAYGMKQGFDLATETEQVFAAPPLVMQAALSGEVQGAINIWNMAAKMKVAGMRELISVADVATGLGLDPHMPLLGYAVSRKAVADKPEVLAGLARASRAAKDLLATDDAAWEALRPIMNADSDAEFEALREGWRAGIPPAGPVDPEVAGKLFAILAEVGGRELTGGLTALPEGLFDPVE